MNVLFVTNTKFTTEPHRDSSSRYRCFHIAEALQSRGHLADVSTMDSLELNTLSRYDVVSVLRPDANRKTQQLLERCDKLGIHTVADFDDLIFNPSLTQNTKLRRRFMRHALSAQQFDEVTVATEELARQRRIKEPSQPVHVLANGLSNFWLSLNSIVNDSEKGVKRIAYLPGTRSHDADFAQVQGAIADFLSADKNAQYGLNVVGPLTMDAASIPEDKVKRGHWIDYMDLPFLISDSWATIAPLQQTPFNQAKSHTKFIESAAFGTPIVCSATDDIARHDVDGLLIANTREEWLSAFEKLSDEAYYRHCQSTLREYVREHCMADGDVDALIARWESHTEQKQHEPITDLSKAG